MHKYTKLRFGVVAAFAVAALTFGTAAPAFADPSGPKDLNGAGSDTTQDVMNGIASVVTNIGNWDAVGTSTITVAGTTFNRPIGSSAGVRALSSSVRGIAYVGTVLPVGTLEYARSSSLGSQTGTELTYIPFARDAVTIAFNQASDFPKDVALGLAGQSSTLFTLRNIYLGTVTSFIDGSGNTVTIKPLLPQADSGTRQYWVGQLGTNEGALASAGVARDVVNGVSVQEHDGTFLTNDGAIVPFSVGQWLAQSNNGITGVNERRGQAVLGNINSVKPVYFDGTRVTTNPDFLPSRLVYNVVETRALTTASPSASDLAVRGAFAGPSSGVCAATTQIALYGFASISNCGSTTIQRGYIN